MKIISFVKRKHLVQLLKIAVFCLLVVEIEHFCYKKTKGFRLQRIINELSFQPEWSLPPLDAEQEKMVSDILSQPFTFFGKGAQCYAFLSEDRKYVLKFNRYDHLRPPFWLTHLPLPYFLHSYRSKKIDINKQKTMQTFTSYKIAFEDLREETGLLALHINPSQDLGIKTTIIDNLGIKHVLEMDKMQFILQKRASLVYPFFTELLRSNQETQAKEALGALVKLIASRCQKGIADKDPDLLTNFGFIDAQPVQIDIGRFSKGSSKRSSEDLKNEIVRITDDFNNWLKLNHPDLSAALQQEITKLQI